jgi:hypothetical protein
MDRVPSPFHPIIYGKALFIPVDYHKTEIFNYPLSCFNSSLCETKLFTTVEDAIAYSPDIIFLAEGALPPEDCKKIKGDAVLILRAGDVRYTPYGSLMKYIGIADLCLVGFEGYLSKIYSRLLNMPCYRLWEPVSKDILLPPIVSGFQNEAVFVGNYYSHLPGGTERVDTLKFIDGNNIKIDIYGNMPICSSTGNHGSIEYNDVFDLYNKSFTVIAEHNYTDVDGCLNPRILMALASGSCCVARYFPQCECLFKNWEDIIFYRHKYELLDILNFLRKNAHIRNEIAGKGQETYRQKYSYANYVLELKNILHLYAEYHRTY